MSRKSAFPFFFVTILLLLTAFSIFVRIQDLGYSNFQGDEVNPMDFMYDMDRGLWNYLLDQKRGPVQYLINMSNVFLFGYHGEGLIRFPFLVFGVLALFTLYKLTRWLFDDSTVAFFASVLMAINGLFIAFSRITQYQSFMYFFIPIGVLMFLKALKEEDGKKFAYSGLIMSMALLAHYDTLSVVPFFVVGFVAYICRNWKKESQILKNTIKQSLLFFSFFLIPALAYYVPFYLGSYFDDTTSGYLQNRLLGGGFMPRTQITLKLLKMYIPKFHIYSLFIFGILGLLLMTPKISGLKIKRYKIPSALLQQIYMILVSLITFASVFSLYPVKPRTASVLVIGLSISISFVLTFSKKIPIGYAALATWFLGSYSFYFYVMKDPRTHVYVVFIPLFILAAYGFVELYRSFKLHQFKSLFLGAALITFFYVSGINWVIFVNKAPEYPWQEKKLLGRAIYKIKRVRHEKIEGVFGFNSYRGWEQVADLYKKGCLVGSFNSNEKNTISYFYMRLNQKQGNAWELEKDSDNLILLDAPHSWEYYNVKETPQNYILLKVIYSHGYPVTYILGDRDVYPEGKLLCET